MRRNTTVGRRGASCATDAARKKRRIQVRLHYKGGPHDRIGPIYVWDNGCGMTADELQRWATMGISQADAPDALSTSVRLPARCCTDQPARVWQASPVPRMAARESGDLEIDSSVVTGAISRFGVGAKRASFFLGRVIRVRRPLDASSVTRLSCRLPRKQSTIRLCRKRNCRKKR